MNGPGDGMPPNEIVVEEELIDNHETETPIGIEAKPSSSHMKVVNNNPPSRQRPEDNANDN